MSPENEVSYEELPPVPNLFDHPAPAASVGAEMFNEAPPFDSLPDPIPPTYGDNYDPAINIPEIYNDDLLMRNRADNMFSIVYDPKPEDKKPSVMYSAGIIVDNNEVTEVGGKPGTLHKVDSEEEAPLDEDLVWYLNVQSDRSASKVSSVKDSSADFSIPLAKTTKGHNGYIQQLHRGAVFIGGGSGNISPFRVTVSREKDKGGNWHTYANIAEGTFRNTMREKVEIKGFKGGSIKKEIVTTGELPVQLEWDYSWPTNDITNATIAVHDAPWDGKEIVTPITNSTGTGHSKCALAILTVTSNPKGGFDAKVKNQLVNTGLLAMWSNGYVDEVSGNFGQYAEASTGIV